ncbi:hypothetical protein ACGIF2_16910 [Cellulomonas sp. P22]|uniref:hypothetical protein n=1 Tax=Cellulomonas sp. P22 TaxID=3373189 RepID=UPI0037A632BB
MRAVAPVFQVYRLSADQPVWWRMVSPNGRGLARTVAPHATVDAAHVAIAVVRLRVDQLEASLRLTERARWRWTLCLDGQPLVESAGDLDRRVRCDHAWRNFVSLAPTASVDPVVHTFRIAGEPRLMSLRGSV